LDILKREELQRNETAIFESFGLSKNELPMVIAYSYIWIVS